MQGVHARFFVARRLAFVTDPVSTKVTLCHHSVHDKRGSRSSPGRGPPHVQPMVGRAYTNPVMSPNDTIISRMDTDT